MSLYQTQYPNNSRVVSGTPAIFKDDVVLLCNTSSATVIINLLEIPNNYWNTTWKLYVVDNSSNASTNNITINAGAGQTINGASSITLSTDDESVVIRISSNNQFVATLSSQNVGNPISIEDEGIEITPNVSSIDFLGDLVTAVASGTDVRVDVNLYDSGWLDLPNYNVYDQGTYGVADVKLKPKFRVINRQVFILGFFVLPLASAGVLQTNFANYPSTTSTDVYTGVDGGFTANSNYTLVSNSPILPTPLLPEVSTPILPNIYPVRRIITTPCVTATAPLNSNSKYPMISYFGYSRIDTTGQMYFTTLPYIESDNLTFLNLFSDLRRNVSSFSNGDVANNYSAYKNSFTGATNNAVASASTMTFNIGFDPNSASNYGGFQIQINSSWLISQSTSLQDIIDAVDNLTTL